MNYLWDAFGPYSIILGGALAVGVVSLIVGTYARRRAH